MVPDIFCNLVNFEIMKLDTLLIPMLNTVQWWSINAMDIISDIKKKFDYTDAFIQRVKRTKIFLFMNIS